VTILINKPMGYVSGQAEDGYKPAVVLINGKPLGRRPDRDALPPAPAASLVPAGRLDIDSVGLLVLTQDGRVAKQLIGEDSAVDKEYLVRVQYTARQAARQRPQALNHGLSWTASRCAGQGGWQNDDQLRFTLREGKKRQIRRMCDMVGLKVIGLKRVRIGGSSWASCPRANGATCDRTRSSEHDPLMKMKKRP
jgi:23S rRNA pseudouridine2604 synthase